MFEMPQGYRDAIHGATSEVDVYIAIGTRIDPTTSDDITAVEGDFLPMSNPAQITDANYQMTEWLATFEAGGIKTSADAGNLAPPIVPTAYPPQVGLWSSVISDGEGRTDFSVTIRLKAKHASAFTVYSYDQNIIEATATYYDGATEVRTASLTSGAGRVQDTQGATYDRIVLRVTRIDQPYSHVKIAEVEFGASETYGKTRLTGDVTFIQEWDPLMQSIPLYELDFSLINVLGDFDTDNPNNAYANIKQDYPVELSFSITGESGEKFTVPCGRFMIASRKSTEDTLDIVCYDARSALEQNRGGLTLSRGQSFGDLFTTLFKGLHIPFAIDDSLFTEYPDQDLVFRGEDHDLLTIMRFIEQYYSIWLIPGRGGFIRVTKNVPNEDYGLIDPEAVTSYPRANVVRTFNYISVAYGPESSRQEYVLDMRTDPAQLRSQIAVNNPLVGTLDRAQGIAQRVQSALYTSKVVTEWLGDPSLDATDTVGIEGRWTQGRPTRYRVLRQEITYDGGIYAETDTYN